LWSSRYKLHPDIYTLDLDVVDISGNNGFYLNGYIRYFTSSDRYPILIMTDSTGSFLWGRLPNDVIGAPPLNGFTSTTDGGSIMLVDAYSGGVSAYIVKFDADGNAGCTPVIMPALSIPETLNVIDSAKLLSDYYINGLNVEFNSAIPAFPEDTLLCVLTPPCTLPPSGLFANNITSSKAKLHWNADAGAIQYKVQYRASTSPVWITLNATTNSKALTGLTANTIYKYRVRSLCAGVPAGPWSSVQEFTTLPLKLEALNTENTFDMHVFPNPSNGIFTLKIPELNTEENFITPITISIKNLLGDEIYSEKLTASGLNHKINLNKKISNGIYLIVISTAGLIYTEQIIILNYLP
ncbi:MAG: T9SS type A sorting domain-containing protein, partial [Chitinophagales bacterium]